MARRLRVHLGSWLDPPLRTSQMCRVGRGIWKQRFSMFLQHLLQIIPSVKCEQQNPVAGNEGSEAPDYLRARALDDRLSHMFLVLVAVTLLTASRIQAPPTLLNTFSLQLIQLSDGCNRSVRCVRTYNLRA